ncbi:hypothetical protein [Reichenbachiella versicolor]|uniref:hypothetical protein n=1 Tax=Reichenbachiella versicolor TaxID=1821036 RepID=UPI000D6E159D|nr:hypothetical protein [Reichenbachiella versicolor]
MFDGSDYPKSLEEETFDQWLENGRNSKIGYEYMLVIWDEFESEYSPIYVENRSSINKYDIYGESVANELLVAAYDLYSEARIQLFSDS